jgi:transcriptional regulator with XRE-family HTH domain
MEDIRARGDTVKAYRETQDISQAELARRAGISRSYLKLIEGGKTPSARITRDLAAALGTEPAVLARTPTEAAAALRRIARRVGNPARRPGRPPAHAAK